MARLLALLLGCSFASLILLVGLKMPKRPPPKHNVELHVVDQRGQPVERFAWTQCVGIPPVGLWRNSKEEFHSGGVAVAEVSSTPQGVALEVRATGLHRTIVGSFESDAVPPRLDVVLADLQAVTGKVIAEGKPVSGARVILIDPRGDLVRGIPTELFFRYEELGSVTASTGDFRIPSDSPERTYFIRATAEGYADAIAGPARVGGDAVQIQLRDGGTIRGSLRRLSGADPSGSEIELYRPPSTDWEPTDHDLIPNGWRVVHSDDRGGFLFEHVEAGVWLVRLRPADQYLGKWGQIPAQSLPFIIEAREHEQVDADLDPTQPPLELHGRVTVGGKPWNAATVFLLLPDIPALVLDRTPVDQDGRWTLRARAPGTYRVLLHGNHEAPVDEARLTDLVEVTPEGAHWERDFDLSEMRSRGHR